MHANPLRRAILLMQQQRFAQAAEAFLEVLAEFPEEPIALVSLGWCQTRCGHLELGEENIKRAIELAPGNDFVHQVHAMHLAKLGRYRKAEQAIRRAINIDPTYSPYLARLAMTLRNQGKFDQALATAQLGLSEDAEHEECLRQLLLAQIELQDYAAAYETTQLALRINPEDAIALAALGYCLIEQRAFARAAGAFRESLRIAPHLSWAKIGLAQCPKEYSYWYARTAKLRQVATSNAVLPLYAIGGMIMLLGVAHSLVSTPPQATLFLKRSLIAFFPLAFLAFSAEPIAIWSLCFNSAGAMMIMPLQRQLANVVVSLLLGSLLIFAGATLAVFGIIDADPWGIFLLSLCVATPVPPLANVYDCELGWHRSMIWNVVALSFAGFFSFLLIITDTTEEKSWSERSFIFCLILVVLNIITMSAALALPRMSYRQENFWGESQR